MNANPELKRHRETDTFLPVGPTKRIQLPVRLQTGPATRQRIYFFWASQKSARFTHLSSAVVQKVCQYLGFLPKVVALRGRNVLSYDVATSEWEVLSMVGPTAAGIYCFAYLSEDLLFVGLIGNSQPEISTQNDDSPLLLRASAEQAKRVTFFMLEKKQLRKLCCRSINCWEAGLLLDKARNAFYFFGGRSHYGEVVKSACQVSFEGGSWSALPDMRAPRSNFLPCWHAQVVFLCSGTSPGAETFDPATGQMTLFPAFTVSPLSETTTSISVALEGEIILFASDSLTVFHTQTGTLRRETRPMPKIHLEGPPVMCRNALYCFDSAKNEAWKLDLHLGGVNERVRIPNYFD